MNTLVPCQSCQAPISINAAACPKCGQPSPLRSSIWKKTAIAGLVISFTVFVVWRGLPSSWIHGAPKIQVNCRLQGPWTSGATCTVESAESDPHDVCWDVNVSCANGSNGTARACETVGAQAKMTVGVPYAIFQGDVASCDQTTGMSVTNLVVK